MPGNRAVFNDAIRKGHNAAWDKQWKKAVEEYRRALAEFPDDLSVRASLAHALEESGQWESAMHEYRHLAQVQPRDPVPWVHVAALQEKMRRPAEAAGTLMQLAELYVAHQLTTKAVEAWRKASKLEPERSDAHLRLAEVYTQGAQHAAAAKEYLALARIFRRREDKAKALQWTHQALKADPRNEEARDLLEELEHGDLTVAVSPPGPVEQAEKVALSRLADTLLEQEAGSREDEEQQRSTARPRISQEEIDALIARAVDAQMRRRVGDAIESYRRLLAAGVERAEVKFNLGLLYFETMRYDDAIALLSETIHDQNFALASHYALGQCFRGLGRMDEAVEHYMQVVKIVDLGSVRREQADELISVYEGLAESYIAKGDREQAESFSRALEEFLTSRGWEDKVHEVRHHLEALRAEGEQISLAQVLEIPGSDQVLEALALSQECLRRGKFDAASDECLRAIQLAPEYLPAHARLAEILIRQNRMEEACLKYQTLAELCVVRGDLARAETLYRSALKAAPADVTNRSKLIDLLIQRGKHDEALEQYLILGDAYLSTGQIARAAERFTEGMRLAARVGNTSAAAITLRHRLAETRVRQNDFKGALAAYQEIRQQSPADERAHFYMVDLEFRLNQPGAALHDLDALLQQYDARGEGRKSIGVLEALHQSHPTQAELAQRLAQHYAALGERDKAVATLDALGEFQLNAGQKQAAAATIRQILALNPPRVEAYKKLLQEIGA